LVCALFLDSYSLYSPTLHYIPWFPFRVTVSNALPALCGSNFLILLRSSSVMVADANIFFLKSHLWM
jgi:hypothetical protein